MHATLQPIVYKYDIFLPYVYKDKLFEDRLICFESKFTVPPQYVH